MTGPPDLATARAVLGVGPDADLDAVRRAFRRHVVRVHPDRSDVPDADRRTHELTLAYAVVRAALTAPATPEPADPDEPVVAAATAPPAPPPPEVRVLDEDTVAVAAPADTTLHLLLEAAHDLGDIVYLDPESGLVEVVVEFVEAPRSSLLMTLQGRSNGTTEVMCTVEPLSGGVSPPTAAVVRLLAATLRGGTSQ